MVDVLPQPENSKVTETGQNNQVSFEFVTLVKLRFVATGMQGWRKHMEDSHIAMLNVADGCSLFGVFDGHGGKQSKLHVVLKAKKWHCMSKTTMQMCSQVSLPLRASPTEKRLRNLS